MTTIRKPLQVVPAPMDGEFLAEVLDELDRVKARMGSERRKYERHGHRCLKVVLIVKQMGTEAAFRVATRNVSQGGASVLHRQMMYPGELCRLVFPLQDGKYLLVRGRIARCRHIRGLLHEIGVRFDRSVSPRDFQDILAQGRESLKSYKEQVRRHVDTTAE